MAQTSEHRRLEEARAKTAAWKKWGPYLSERQWGTVREDYSADGNAWDYFSRRPVFGGAEKFQTDRHWRDCLLFYEYFHGDNGAGLGASHQTGWTGCVAALIELFGRIDPKKLLEVGKKAAQSREAQNR
jgi:hypothetical protein